MSEKSELTMKRTFRATISRVFDAWCMPDTMSLWLLCSSEGTASAENHLEIGGTYNVEMRKNGRMIGSAFGKYLRIESPHLLEFTWSSENAGVRDSVVKVELREVPEGTELVLTHSLDPGSEQGRSHGRGWAVSLDNLERCLGRPE